MYPHTTNPHDTCHFFYWTRIILALFTGDTHTFYILFGRTLDFPYPPEAPPHVLCFVFNDISLPHVKYNPYYKYKNLIFIFFKHVRAARTWASTAQNYCHNEYIRTTVQLSRFLRILMVEP